MQRYKNILLVGVLVLAAGGFAYVREAAALTSQEERAQLEKELEDLEAQIQNIEHDITKTQAEKNTLQNQIAALKNKIKKLDLQISQSNKIINDLRSQIKDTTASIDKTMQDIENAKAQLSGVLQSLYEESQKGQLEILLAGRSLSDFFGNLAALEALNGRSKDLLENMEKLNAYLGNQKEALESDKAEEENFVKIQMLQKLQNQISQEQQQKLLNVTKGKETEYQKLLVDKRKRAQEIRSRIFELIGVPKAPTFGQAVEIATYVSSQTGVRPALLLAVLTQESNIGKNVGQCFLKDTKTGSGVKISSGASVRNVMKPSRDVQPFLTITAELGRDPFSTSVSCPIPSVGGYGGAMGPAQFIPATWIGYRDRLSAITGKAGDPWDIRDAFLAAGLYLADKGAAKQTQDAEWRAAMMYFSGTVNMRYRFYGDNVIAIARQYEADIKDLEG
ncbi:MAG: lytic murein transglycosylase [Candidatus Wildermuthbacteria bacterium]|nr:lytic murein transglycosylase [Candidatus Wildermuthbacteria bacterium]